MLPAAAVACAISATVLKVGSAAGSAAAGIIMGVLSEDASTTAPARPTSLGTRRRTAFFTVTRSPSTFTRRDGVSVGDLHSLS